MNSVHNPLLINDKNNYSLEQLFASLDAAVVERDQYKSEVQQLRSQLEWFKQQLFGQKSERRTVNPDQLALFQAAVAELSSAPPDAVSVPAHERKHSNLDVLFVRNLTG